MTIRKTLLFVLLLAALSASCLPGAQPGGTVGDSAVSGFAGEAKEAGGGGGSGPGESAGQDVVSDQPGPGGSMPSGTPAPQNDWDNSWMCLNGTYQRLCKEGTDERVRVELQGKITNSVNDPTACSYGGKRALRIIYKSGSLKVRGLPSLWYVDAPVADDGEVRALVSTSDPADMDYYLVPREQDGQTGEKSCANKVCLDADQNGVQDADRCAVLTIGFSCLRPLEPGMGMARTVIEISSHDQGPLSECTHYSLQRAPVKMP